MAAIRALREHLLSHPLIHLIKMWKPLESLQGLTRTLQGPSLLDLKKQVGVEIEDFQTIFLLGTFSFPLGNLIGEF